MVASVLSAAESWANKDPARWTPKDIERLLANSPWAQRADAFFSTPGSDDENARAAASIPGPAPAGMAGRNGVTDGKWDGGVGRNVRTGAPSLPIMIRWDSALPVREALLRSQPDRPPVALAASDKDYIITVMGLAPGGKYRQSGHLQTNSQSDQAGDSQARESQDPEEMLEGLMKASILAPNGKPPILPEDVKLDPETGTLHLFFPRTASIDLSDKEVTFATRFGSIRITKTFRLKDMTYKGKLEL
ncbi:MAG: hypothetical protein WB992_24095 [Bryobacteraceae bacterium]